MDRNKELIKNTLILSIGTFVPKLMTLVTLPILTACLTTSEYGNYDLILSLVSVLIPCLTMQIQQAVFRNLISSNITDDRETFITTSLLFIILSFLCACPVLYIGLYFTNLSPSIRLLICLMLVSESIYYLLGQMLRGLGKNLQYSFSIIVYSATNMAFVILFVLVMKWGLLGVLISLTAGYIVSCIYMMIIADIVHYINFNRISINSLKELLRFSAPIVPSSISLWIVNLSDRMVITAFLGAGINGIYSVANKIPQLYSTAYNIFNLAWTETASRVYDDGDPAKYYSSLFMTLYDFLIGVMLFLIAVTPIVFKVLVNDQFSAAYEQVQILYFGVFFNSIVQYYSGIYIAFKRTKEVGISSAVGAVINLVINLIFVKKVGLYAASISTAISYLVIALYRAYDISKVVKIKYNIKRLIIGMLVFIIAASFSYCNSIIYNFLCVLISLAYNYIMNGNLIKIFFTSMKIGYKNISIKRVQSNMRKLGIKSIEVKK